MFISRAVLILELLEEYHQFGCGNVIAALNAMRDLLSEFVEDRPEILELFLGQLRLKCNAKWTVSAFLPRTQKGL